MEQSLSRDKDKRWSVYMILATDNRLYTGITTDIIRRWKQHSGAPGGARFFRGRKPAKLIYLESGHDRSSASRTEAAIKKMPRPEKMGLITSPTNIAEHISSQLPHPITH